MCPAIRLEHVRRCEGAALLLDDIDLAVPEGTLFALVGADGAGKTTLLRTMAGLLKPQEGSVRIGEDLLYSGVSANASVQALLGYMPQRFGLYADLSVQENLELYADLFGLKRPLREERMRHLLDVTDLARCTAQKTDTLSGGMKQKLGLACALLNHPRILLLDEPSVGVDPLSRRELWEILRANVRDESMTVVVSTTYMDEAEKADIVCVLEEGRVLLTATPQEVAAKAEGLTYLVKPPKTMSLRILQTMLYDERALVLDAVPQADGVRVLLKEADALAKLENQYPGTQWECSPSDVEAGYLVYKSERGLLAERVVPLPETVLDETIRIEPVVDAKNLVRRFGTRTAVDHTTFQVMPGEIFGLLGPNGAGKTTTFKMLCGLITVTSGSLYVAGLDACASREETRRRLGYMSQRFALYGELSVLENLRFFGRAYGLSSDALKVRISELLAEYDLAEYGNRAAKTLSGGVKQRLAMAVSLIHRPEILFLDEPTSGADVPTRRQFWRRIAALAAQGTSIIVTTHFMQEALYCDRLMIQDSGRPLFLGTPEDLQGRSTSVDEAFIGIVTDARRQAQKPAVEVSA